MDATISELQTKLGAVPVEAVQKLETRRRALNDDVDSLNRALQRHQIDGEAAARSLQQIDSELERAQFDDVKARLAQRRTAAIADAKATLEKILRIRTEAVRAQLDAKIVETYGRITFKEYVPRLDGNFRLTLHQKVGPDELVVAKSTGENQVLSLAFVGALAALARERALEQTALLGAEGGVFPIVMDAAFSSLDENYRRDIARALPGLAPQVIVMVSKAQGVGVVAEQLAPRLGRTSVVTFNTSKEGQESESIELAGRVYDYVRAGSESDSAEIKEIK